MNLFMFYGLLIHCLVSLGNYCVGNSLIIIVKCVSVISLQSKTKTAGRSKI